MNRTWGALLAAATTVVAISSCNQPASSMYIAGVMFPPTVTGGASCTYTPNATGPFALEPTTDIAAFSGSAPTYNAILLVANQLQQTGNSSQLRVETSRVILDHAVVYVEDASGHTLSAFTRAIQGELDPASGTTPTYNVVSVLVVDGTAGDLVAHQVLSKQADQTVTAKVTLHGTTVGGDSVSSAPYPVSVNFCLGCLVSGIPQGGCSSTTTSSSSADTPCIFGQDQSINCCTYDIGWCHDIVPTFPNGAD